MNVRHRTWAMLAAAGLALPLVFCSASLASAQPPPGNDRAKAKTDAAGAAKKTEPTATEKLAIQEGLIADKYKHLEEVLLRMAELNAASDPRRAALLKKAVAQSKEQLIGLRFERLVDLLGKEQLSRALENQTDLDQDLRALLDLLMSENREKTIKDAKARLRGYIKAIGVLIKQQKDIQGRTAGGDDHKPLAGQQGKLADKTGDLAKEIRRNEEKGEDAKADSAKGEKKKGESGKGKVPKGGKSESGKGKSEGGQGQKSEEANGDSQQDSEQNPAKTSGGRPAADERGEEEAGRGPPPGRR